MRMFHTRQINEKRTAVARNRYTMYTCIMTNLTNESQKLRYAHVHYITRNARSINVNQDACSCKIEFLDAF